MDLAKTIAFEFSRGLAHAKKHGDTKKVKMFEECLRKMGVKPLTSIAPGRMN